MMSSTNEVVFANLREAMLYKLDRAVDIVARGHQRDAVAVARQELPRLVAGLRALIEQHVPDAEGYCVSCGRSRWWRRQQHVPCRVLLDYYLATTEFDEKPPLRQAKNRVAERMNA